VVQEHPTKGLLEGTGVMVVIHIPLVVVVVQVLQALPQVLQVV
jgi:hypothetical protein